MVGAATRTVRDETFDLLRRLGLTTLFANPGSTEVPLLAGLPSDLQFVLALHEGSVIGAASGYALGRRAPALALLHTVAGLGNAVAALATARVNRAPLVVLVGQQDRRHLAQEPFLAGRLHGLAGEYPVSVEQPVRPQDVPGAIGRAHHEAVARRGPALVIVPMDDWLEPAGALHELAAAESVVRAAGVDAASLDGLAALLWNAKRPALVAGAGADEPETWPALVALAERLGGPVYQEAFGARAGFPQDHELFAGHLPASRDRLRQTLAGNDLVLAVGAPVFRQYPFVPGPLVEAGVRLAVLTDDPAEAHRSPVELAVVAPLAAACRELADRLEPRTRFPAPPRPLPPPVAPPGDGRMRPGHVFEALADLLPADTVLLEETPSSRPELHARVPARAPLGFVSAAMGGLGFALPAAIGLRLALPERPVLAVVGDGSALYQIQALWTAAHYGTGFLAIVLANGGYAIMDRLAERNGGGPPWPGFPEVSVDGLATALGCPARRISRHDELLSVLRELLPALGRRTEPLVLVVEVEPDTTFEP
jgi:benzoylformate decarboxylase